MAFRNILGYFPTYFRPPYSECNEMCQSVLKRYGYHSTYYSLVTQDYMYDAPELIQSAKDIWDQSMSEVNNTAVKYISISHDIHYQTAYNLTSYMLDYMRLLNYSKSVTVGECLGDPKENWYRTASGAPNASSLLYLKKSMASGVNDPAKSLVGAVALLAGLVFLL